MPLYTLYIVNKAGGLIYNRVRAHVPGARWPMLTSAVRVAGPFRRAQVAKQHVLANGVDISQLACHQLSGRSALARMFVFAPKADEPSGIALRQLAPVSEGGIETLEADTFTLQCLQTRTGMLCLATVPLWLLRVSQVLCVRCRAGHARLEVFRDCQAEHTTSGCIPEDSLRTLLGLRAQGGRW